MKLSTFIPDFRPEVVRSLLALLLGLLRWETIRLKPVPIRESRRHNYEEKHCSEYH